MNLVFNAEALRPPITGVGHYSLHLLEQFQHSGEVGSIHCFTGTGWRDGAAQIAATEAWLAADDPEGAQSRGGAVQKLRKLIGAVPGAKAAYDAAMDNRFRRHADAVPDAVYHETNYILKPFSGPCITTVHDLSYLRFPEFHPGHLVEWLSKRLPVSLRRADRVITVSDVVRGEIVEHFDIAPEKVRTVYEGVDARYRPRSARECAPTLERYGLRYGGYVLLVATLEPRKGIGNLLDAWDRLPAALRREYPLVMTGSAGWRNEELRARLAKMEEEGSARHLGFVPSAVLPYLYSGAALFSYPSIYEGFGLPVLDAMASGVPVICRAGTSMAEFSRGACLLCESGEAAELADKLQRLLHSEDERQSWGRRGLAEAGNFSWERCARETAAIYREVA